MTQPLRIAQLASFAGNFGDSANILGTRRKLRDNLRPYELEFTDLEYLDFDPHPLWRKRAFDDGFIDLANRHDALIIGGGGFFEIALDASASATPIDLSVEQLGRIRVPLIFHGLGVDVSYGITEERKRKFGAFLAYLTGAPNVLVSVRSDGSLEKLTELYGAAAVARVHKIPDGGFFARPGEHRHAELRAGRRTVALNLAGDNAALRFPDPANAPQKRRFFGAPQPQPARVSALDTFFGALKEALVDLFERDPEVDVVLVPHIPEDLHLIDRFIATLGAPWSRRRISVAPYVHGVEACDYILDLYRRCDLVIGMRFHACVCAIGLGRPAIGLGSLYPKVQNLFRELGMEARCFSAADPRLAERLKRALAEPGIAAGTQMLDSQIDSFHSKIKDLVQGWRKS
jgi:polysaccharide pyruvyl transferase WcaK-like protein